MMRKSESPAGRGRLLGLSNPPQMVIKYDDCVVNEGWVAYTVFKEIGLVNEWVELK